MSDDRITPPVSVVKAGTDSQPRRLHGCITVFLNFLILSAIAKIGFSLVIWLGIVTPSVDVPMWASLVGVLSAISVIVGAVGLYRWKRWRFVTIVCGVMFDRVISYSVGFGLSVLAPSILYLVLLFLVLRLGNAWTQLD